LNFQATELNVTTAKTRIISRQLATFMQFTVLVLRGDKLSSIFYCSPLFPKDSRSRYLCSEGCWRSSL